MAKVETQSDDYNIHSDLNDSGANTSALSSEGVLLTCDTENNMNAHVQHDHAEMHEITEYNMNARVKSEHVEMESNEMLEIIEYNALVERDHEEMLEITEYMRDHEEMLEIIEYNAPVEREHAEMLEIKKHNAKMLEVTEVDIANRNWQGPPSSLTFTDNILSHQKRIVGNSSDEAGLMNLQQNLDMIEEKISTSHGVASEHLIRESFDIKTLIALKTKEYNQYLPLYRATLDADWEAAKQIIEHDNKAITAAINQCSETALHIAVEAGKSHLDFVKKLVEVMEEKDLEVQDNEGNTALCMAAIVGNLEAVKILVEKNRGSIYIPNDYKYLPVHEAGLHAHKETLAYLRKVTNDNTKPCPYIGEVGFKHLLEVVVAEFYDVALDLVTKYPQLATMEVEGYNSPLTVISKKASAFSSGTRLGLLERLVYPVLQVKLEETYEPNNGDIENTSSHARANRMQVYASICFKAIYQRLHFMLSEGLGFIAPHTKAKKLVNHHARQLVKSLCEAIRLSNNNATYIRCTEPAIIEAAKNGIPEVIEEIVYALPLTIWCKSEGKGIFQWAVVNRCEKVFNIIYQMGDHKQRLLKRLDDSKNHILHLAGKLAPPHKLNLVSGAALQMQREIQWYKEVEKFVTQAGRQKPNQDKKTPSMVFSEEHAQLVIDGEKWMKDTANSCTIAAALIVTMVFAAAITVPGGLDQETGNPLFSEKSAFNIFFISNAVSLFTSTTSLLIFLSILTARYAEEDFRFALPNRLIIGLVTLFVSTASMMIAFTSILYLFFGERNTWSIIPTIGLACLPVAVFVTLQFPLLLDVISSTYGRGIFGKQSSRRLY